MKSVPVSADSPDIRVKLARLHELRTELEALRREEAVAAAECVAYFRAHKMTAYAFAADSQALLERPATHVVNVNDFTTLALTLQPNNSAAVLDCVRHSVSYADAKRILGKRVSEVCTSTPGAWRLRIVGTRGARKSEKLPVTSDKLPVASKQRPKPRGQCDG